MSSGQAAAGGPLMAARVCTARANHEPYADAGLDNFIMGKDYLDDNWFLTGNIGPVEMHAGALDGECNPCTECVSC